MRVHVLVLLGVFLVATPARAQTPAAPDAGQAAAVGAVQKAVLKIAEFQSGRSRAPESRRVLTSRPRAGS